MNRSSVCLLTAAIALATPVSADVFKFTGTAESQDGKALYEEQHTIEGSCDNGAFRPLEHRVIYSRQAEGGNETFAEKSLDYSPSNIRPTVIFQQPDFQESLEISYADSGSVNVVWQQPGGDTKRSSVAVSENLVVDAGFDNLVRRNWEKVVSGESVKFRFLAPTRGTDYAFILEPTQSQAVRADHVVQIRPDSMLLKFLVDPIILGYNNKGALTAYSGLTNVRENTDQNYTATIRYAASTYPECELTR
ncbi:hypothetical protein SAMN04488490_0843 [Marinobacter sp. LV10R510-11A]|uniref:hypothetical protein n=1 Tax=Marinobacter sp. LV10R510-11A TaxID=1415568 RepID=UPI000BBF7E66|nr:hypothetical protein [Marinobacter sp. LV10R510-11A]SOB75278.1 hypothetical protein SAMN04488490_0843 [Marinobacter sp. LV10R510-11A]